MHESLFYEKTAHDNTIRCNLCPHNCYVQEGKFGACGVRKNTGGRLYTLVYGKAIAMHLDPIEKKPLFHFKPGSKIFSYATAGCNFRCSFCQNFDISQISKGRTRRILGQDMLPERIIKEAMQLGADSIAMTYNEPTIQFEYALDVCKEAKKHGLSTVFVSNGYINPEPVNMIAPYLDAINIDLKGFTDDYYKSICGARLQPLLDSIKHYVEKGIWTEITTLVIPTVNDSQKELEQIATFIASIDVNIPWHVSRFHPDYKMTGKEITPIDTLHLAYRIGRKAGLEYVYVGNVLGDVYEHTACPGCGKRVIERYGFQITKNNMEGNRCVFCKEEIAGVFGS